MDLLRRFLPLMALALASPAFAQNAPAAAAGPVYVITHVDILGNTNNATAMPMLRQFAEDSRKDPGNVRFDVVQMVGRANHYTIVEVWQSRQAFEAHNAAEHTKQFREKIHPILGSPWDDGMFVPLP